MSTVSTARSDVARATPRHPRSAPPRLRLVHSRGRHRAGAQASGHAGRGVFILLVGLLLISGLLGLLMINTALAQGAFTTSTLQQRLGELSAQESALAEQIALMSAPQALERRARALGMVRMRKAAFLDLRDGTVAGTPRVVRVPGLASATGDPALAGGRDRP
jgi:hypothetical protein